MNYLNNNHSNSNNNKDTIQVIQITATIIKMLIIIDITVAIINGNNFIIILN